MGCTSWLMIPALLLVSWAGVAFAGVGPTAQEPEVIVDVEPTQDPDLLADTMLELQSALKKLRRSVRKQEQESDSLAHLQVIQRTALITKDLVPAMTADVPEADRAAFVKAYRREMLVLLQKCIACEIAVLDGDTDAANALYKEIAAMEDSGHERFTADG